MNKFSKYFAVALSSLALVSAAQAEALDVKTGSTSLTLTEGFAGLIIDSGMSVKKVIPGKVKAKLAKKDLSVSFPISGGVIDTESLLSEITQSGGFNLSTKAVEAVDPAPAVPAISVSITDLVVNIPDAGTTATVSALLTVDGSFRGRVTLFDLALPASFTAPLNVPNNKKIVISVVDVKLTADGAAALNDAFDVVDVFTTDLVVGDVKINAILASKKSL